MLGQLELTGIARARIADAEALSRSNRYDGAVYLCGYAVEIALKVRICRTLEWAGFPDSAKDFKEYQSFRTHDLDVLLHLSGVEKRVKQNFLPEWSVVGTWNPEMRYKPTGSATEESVERMIEASKRLMGVLCDK
jgi:HEPN domain-containing protein